MSSHNVFEELLKGAFPATGRIIKTAAGYLLGWGTTVGTVNGVAVENWSVGAMFLDVDAATDNQLWLNVGTATTASWEAVSSA